ncbi:MAG: FAD:protein FMN transferase [Pseudomonadota bacterium]
MPAILVYLCILILSSLHAGFASEWVVSDGEAMGTTIHTEVWHQNQQLAEQMAQDVMSIMENVNQLMSPYIESSELSVLNREASQKPIPVSDELYDVIKRSLEYSELTAGAFDITFASVGYLYDYRESIRPDQEQIDSHVEQINYKNIVLDPVEKSVFFKEHNVRIDLGGIAKGFAVDLAIARAKELGIDNILVTAGGDSRILGDRLGRPWVIGIRHPLDKNQVIAKIPMIDEALSTSGDYERYFDEDGVRYHHILDPKTGDSARNVRSVTILGPDAMDTDALSTSVFVMGPEKGLKLLDRLPKIEGIIVDQKGNLLFSSGLQNLK